MRLKSHRTVEQIARKHRMDVSDIQRQLDMGIPIEHEHTRNKTLATDIALQHLDEFPDYYTRLKKMEASARKEHKKFKDVIIDEEGILDWFGKSESKDKKPGWVNVVTGGTCASDEPGEGVPKCVSSEKRANMTKAERLSAARRKKTADPGQQEKSGAAKPTYVSTDRSKKAMKEEMDLQEVKDRPGKGSGKKDACYNKVKSRYDVWPSAYASGALVKCRKVGASNWGTKSESTDSLGYDWDTPVRERPDRYCPKCEKLERRTECKYGVKYWDMFSLPAEVVSSKKDYNITLPHPGNMPEEKDHEYSMARSELSTIMNAAKKLKKKMKGEGNIEAWVQSKITKAADYIDTAADYVDSRESKVNEDTTIEDANGNTFLRIINIIRPESLKTTKGIGNRLVGESISSEPKLKPGSGLGGGKPVYMKGKEPKPTGAELPKLPLAKGEGGSPYEPYNAPKENPRNPYVPAPKTPKPKVQLAHYESEGSYIEEQVADTDTAQEKFDRTVNATKAPGLSSQLKIKTLKYAAKIHPSKVKTLESFMIEAKKSEMKCNSPKSEPVGDSLTGKSHVVKACANGEEKLIRFGQRGVKGSPKKKGESKEYASRRNRFKTRHAKNIAKGPMSAAYWANKVKW
jgi:hypothetical protein